MSTITDPTTDPTAVEPIDVAPDTGEPSGLRSAADTANREQERLERTQGKSGLAALAATAGMRVRDLGTERAARDGLRYRPVAWTVLAVIAVAFYLPGRAERTPATQQVASPSPVVTVVTPTTLPVDNAAPPPTLPSGQTPTFTPAPVTPTIVTTPPSSSGDSFTPPPTTTAPPTTAAPAPLTIRGWGWASRIEPLPGDEIPDDTLPVANRLGQVDKVSFIRLAGDVGTLELVEHPDGAREALGAAQIAACPILDPDWAEGGNQTLADAPAWDPDACVGSVEQDDRWIFDLGSFPFRTGPAGFALVPTADAPADFQITFRIG